MGMRIDPSKRFERERTRAKQEQTAANQQAQEAIARKFASQGLGSSGAAIRTAAQVEQAGQESLDKRLEDVSSREESEGLRLQEIEDAKRFQSSERAASEKFSGNQAALQRAIAQKQFLAQHDLAKQGLGLSKQQFEATYGKEIKVPVYGPGSLGKQKIVGYETKRVGGTVQDAQKLAEAQSKIAQQEHDINKETLQWTKLSNILQSRLPAEGMKALASQAGFTIDKDGFITLNGVPFQVIAPPKQILNSSPANNGSSVRSPGYGV
jgi:hypothetical protein